MFFFGATLKQNLLEVDFKAYAIAVLAFFVLNVNSKKREFEIPKVLSIIRPKLCSMPFQLS